MNLVRIVLAAVACFPLSAICAGLLLRGTGVESGSDDMWLIFWACYVALFGALLAIILRD